jgi:hypothetical protein
MASTLTITPLRTIPDENVTLIVILQLLTDLKESQSLPGKNYAERSSSLSKNSQIGRGGLTF